MSLPQESPRPVSVYPRSGIVERKRDEVLETLRLQNQARIRIDRAVARQLLLDNSFVVTPTGIKFFIEIRSLGLDIYDARLADRTASSTLFFP